MPHFPKPWFRKSRKSWYVTLDGHQHDLGTNRESAFAQYQVLIALAGKADTSKGLKLASLVELFLAWVGREKAAKTLRSYSDNLHDLVAMMTTDILAKDVLPLHVEAWVGQHGSWGPSTRRKALASVTRLFNWAVDRKLLTVSPIGRLEKPDDGIREHFMTPAEYTFFHDVLAKKPDHRDVLDFLWWTGARPQEAYAFEARHLNPLEKTLSLERKKAKGKKVVRVVYLDDDAMAIVTRRRAQCPTPASPLFTNSKGQRWSAHAFAQSFEHLRWKLAKHEAALQGLSPAPEHIEALVAQEQALRPNRKARALITGRLWQELATPFVRPIVPYSIRHGYGVRLLTAGVDPMTVAHLMGHTSTQMLMRVYSHLNKAHDRMHEALKKAKGN